MNVIQAIALLCQIHTGVTTEQGVVWQMTQQMRCQQYFAECFEKKRSWIAWSLEVANRNAVLECIKEQSKK